MARGIKEIQAIEKSAGELEPYHQLIELQKRIIRLAQQNERAQEECSRLREQLVTEMFSAAGTNKKIRRKMSHAFKQLPGMATAKSNLAVWFRPSPKNLQPLEAVRNYF